ncbi:MAG: T9SS type A sorting domain-containing protein [Bacteroidetes bacterium]|nr:T9SS type A sorting domain-containing protein [Bacteroidota bacterium]
MNKSILILLVFSFMLLNTQAQTITDIDGNIYNTITLGTQIWTKENLKTTRFNNGDSIATTSLPINNDSTSIFQWSYNQDSLNIPVYGRLYTWYAVTDNRNVCPTGWHVPSEAEWISLANFLGGDTIAGDKMKEIGTTHWLSTTGSVSNSSDFTALPGGQRGNPTGFSNLYTLGAFWSTTAWGSSAFPRAYIFSLQANSGALHQSISVANCGFAVRCVKDLTAGIQNLIPEDEIKIYPNPTKDKINISLEEIKNSIAFIYDISGKLIFQQSLIHKINPIDVNFLPVGVYVIKVVGMDFSVERKLVKE